MIPLLKPLVKYTDIWLYHYDPAIWMRCENHTLSLNFDWAYHLCCQRIKKLLQTRNINRGSSVNDATVWAHTVSARCSCLDFETHISICGVGELQSGSDDICKWAWGEHTHKKVKWLHGVYIYIYICERIDISCSLGTDISLPAQTKLPHLLNEVHTLLQNRKNKYVISACEELHGAWHKHYTLKQWKRAAKCASVYFIMHATPAAKNWIL